MLSANKYYSEPEKRFQNYSAFKSTRSDLSRLKFSTSLFLPSFPSFPTAGDPLFSSYSTSSSSSSFQTLLLIVSRLETPERVRDSPEVQQKNCRKNNLFPNVKLVYKFCLLFFWRNPHLFFCRETPVFAPLNDTTPLLLLPPPKEKRRRRCSLEEDDFFSSFFLGGIGGGGVVC